MNSDTFACDLDVIRHRGRSFQGELISGDPHLFSVHQRLGWRGISAADWRGNRRMNADTFACDLDVI